MQTLNQLETSAQESFRLATRVALLSKGTGDLIGQGVAAAYLQGILDAKSVLLTGDLSSRVSF